MFLHNINHGILGIQLEVVAVVCAPWVARRRPLTVA